MQEIEKDSRVPLCFSLGDRSTYSVNRAYGDQTVRISKFRNAWILSQTGMSNQTLNRLVDMERQTYLRKAMEDITQKFSKASY